MTKEQYRYYLTRPEWKTKRKEILKRDGHSCNQCGRKTGLQIHHLYYLGDRKPWEYSNDALITLCRKCHEDLHGIVKQPTTKKKVYKKNTKPKIKIANKGKGIHGKKRK